MEANEFSEIIYINALNSIKFLGPKRIDTLLKHFGSARAAWESPPAEVVQVIDLKNYTDRLKNEQAKIDPAERWDGLKALEIEVVSLNCPEYPKLLKQLHYPPPLLYYRGSLHMIEQPAIAIVGSRRCTFYGQEVAHRLAVELSSAGVSVISGMALGIDTAAHQGALESSGYTAAVLGCGVDKCYPPQNADLMNQIITGGIVFSEFPVGTEPLPVHFPRRNRIISGLSLGTVVVEATARSGALITASYALEQNREVFAVPGNVGSPYSRGSHRLIKEGARLVESAADILDELNLNTSFEEQMTIDKINSVLSEQEKSLLQRIPYQPIHIDNIIQLSGIRAAEASTLLLSLELKQSIRQTPGKYFCRI